MYVFFVYIEEDVTSLGTVVVSQIAMYESGNNRSYESDLLSWITFCCFLIELFVDGSEWISSYVSGGFVEMSGFLLGICLQLNLFMN